MKEEITFTAKQVGERVKERRLELNLTMPELGKRIGVNKSTIQRYEADGVDPKRTMIINGLAEALLTTPEWLTGLSEEKEYDAKTLCQRDIESHIAKCLDSVSVVQGEPHQQLLTTFLGKMIDLYSVLCYHFADAMAEVDRVAADEGLKESLMRYAIVPFPVSWTVKMKKKQKETQDILSYHTQAAGCSDKARAKASGGRQPIEECGRTGL